MEKFRNSINRTIYTGRIVVGNLLRVQMLEAGLPFSFVFAGTYALKLFCRCSLCRALPMQMSKPRACFLSHMRAVYAFAWQIWYPVYPRRGRCGAFGRPRLRRGCPASEFARQVLHVSSLGCCLLD